MKKLFFAFVIGACAFFVLPSCGEKGAASGSANDTTQAVTEEKTDAAPAEEVAAIDKLAEMKVTKENTDEVVATFGAVVDEGLKVIETKDAAKIKAYAEKFEAAINGLDGTDDLFTPEQQQAIKEKIEAFTTAIAESGVSFE